MPRSKYTVDYTQDETGRWSAKPRGGDAVTPPRETLEDCVGDVFDFAGDAVIEVGDVREWPGLGL